MPPRRHTRRSARGWFGLLTYHANVPPTWRRCAASTSTDRSTRSSPRPRRPQRGSAPTAAVQIRCAARARCPTEARTRARLGERWERPRHTRCPRGHPDARPGAERERPHGALGRQRPPRMPGPAADRRSPPARARPPCLHEALQAQPAPPVSRPRTTRFERSTNRRIQLANPRSWGEPA
jgi:hypothetical protein